MCELTILDKWKGPIARWLAAAHRPLVQVQVLVGTFDQRRTVGQVLSEGSRAVAVGGGDLVKGTLLLLELQELENSLRGRGESLKSSRQ